LGTRRVAARLHLIAHERAVIFKIALMTRAIMPVMLLMPGKLLSGLSHHNGAIGFEQPAS
jgi:hypothetical protein